MNFAKAVQHLLDGKKIRLIKWPKSKYIYFHDGILLNESDVLISDIYLEGWLRHEYELYDDTAPNITDEIE